MLVRFHKTMAGSLLAASLIMGTVSLMGHAADPVSPKAHEACVKGHSCAKTKACPVGMHQHYDHKAMMAEFQQKVGLSDAQKKKVDALHEASEAKTKPMMQEMMSKRKALYEYLANTDATEIAALSKQAEINEIRNQISQEHIKTMFQVKAVLTPEQQQKAADLMREKMAEFEKKKEQWHQGGW